MLTALVETVKPYSSPKEPYKSPKNPLRANQQDYDSAQLLWVDVCLHALNQRSFSSRNVVIITAPWFIATFNQIKLTPSRNPMIKP